MTDQETPFEGGCACGYVRYQMLSKPLIVHGCHCRWCQRESGASFAVNALIEANRLRLTDGSVSEVLTPTRSGIGQRFSRCPKCQVTLWTNYLAMRGGLAEGIRFLRVGTLDDPSPFPPDVHIFTSSKQPWIILPPGIPVFEEYYSIKNVWSLESQERQSTVQEAMGSTAG